MSPAKPHAPAFTLLEMLIAMALLGIVVASSVTVFRGVAQSWQRGEVRSQRYQNARAIVDVVGRELASALSPASRGWLVGLAANDTPLKSGAVGPSLFCVTLIPGLAPAETAEVGYWLRASDHMLMRHLQAIPDGDPRTADQDEPLGTHVSAWSLAYFDGTAWQDRWDSREGAPQQGRLPKAVRVGVTVQDAGGRDGEHFDTTITVPSSQ